MTGVEILNKYTVCTTPLCVFVVFILAAIGAIIFFSAIDGCASDTGEWICFVCAILCMLTFVVFGILAVFTDCFKAYSHIEYKVTIDDSVSMNEFLDKYEILDQEGKIYTVKEKEQ